MSYQRYYIRMFRMNIVSVSRLLAQMSSNSIRTSIHGKPSKPEALVSAYTTRSKVPPGFLLTIQSEQINLSRIVTLSDSSLRSFYALSLSSYIHFPPLPHSSYTLMIQPDQRALIVPFNGTATRQAFRPAISRQPLWIQPQHR
jgi:hypothetical protein